MLGIFGVSLLASTGLAILLVEKGEDWPVSFFRRIIDTALSTISDKLSSMLECTVCAAFWTSLITDLFLFIITDGAYFLWPLTGFASSGLIWLMIEFLNTLDKDEDE